MNFIVDFKIKDLNYAYWYLKQDYKEKRHIALEHLVWELRIPFEEITEEYIIDKINFLEKKFNDIINFYNEDGTWHIQGLR